MNSPLSTSSIPKRIHLPGANFQKASPFAKTENHSIHHLSKYLNCQNFKYLNCQKLKIFELLEINIFYLSKAKNIQIQFIFTSSNIYPNIYFLNCQNMIIYQWSQIQIKFITVFISSDRCSYSDDVPVYIQAPTF